MSKQTDFFDKYADYAMSSQSVSGVPASITLAQAALESGWGLSGLTVKANNFFGIKAGSTWKGAIYESLTKEFVNGAYITITSKFRKYASPKDCFIDHSTVYAVRKAKAAVGDTLDVTKWATALKSAGYATDPLYASKLINMINQYDLTKYDKLAPKKKIAKLLFICVATVGLSLGVAYYKKWLSEPKKIVFTVLVGLVIGIIINASLTAYERNKYN